MTTRERMKIKDILTRDKAFVKEVEEGKVELVSLETRIKIDLVDIGVSPTTYSYMQDTILLLINSEDIKNFKIQTLFKQVAEKHQVVPNTVSKTIYHNLEVIYNHSDKKAALEKLLGHPIDKGVKFKHILFDMAKIYKSFDIFESFRK